MLKSLFLVLSAATLTPVHSTFPLSPEVVEGSWTVEDLGNRGVIDNSHLELVFGEDGTFAGFSGCNTMIGTFDLDGVKMVVRNIALADKQCAPALMMQERRLLETLRAIVGFDIDHTGALILRCPDRDCLIARRAEL